MLHRRVRWCRRSGAALLGLLSGCVGGGRSGAPVELPSPITPTGRDVPVLPVPLVLPAVLPATRWRVHTESTVQDAGPAESSARMRASALVEWQLTRTRHGALQGTGVVDSLSIRNSLDSADTPPRLRRLLVDLVVDSTTVRVTPRPVLTNECDRQETVAAGLARTVAIRIPDGVTVGGQWMDSTVSFVCREAVPLAVTSVMRTRVVEQTTRRVVLERLGTMRIRGSGGSPYRALEIVGEGSARERVEVDRGSGVVDRVRGEQRLTLRLSPAAPRGGRPVAVVIPRSATVVITQQVTTTVDRQPK